MNDDAIIDRIAAAVADRVAPKIPIDIDLWDSETCAQFMKRTPRHFMERIAPLPNFPRAIRLPSETGRSGNPLWKAREVIAWVEKHQEPKRKTA